jgi:NAD/NADP transhydrogenase beta subunit
MNGDSRFTIISLGYVAAALLFVFGLRRLSSPRTARSGNRLAAIGMLIALIATLLDRSILSFWEIGIGTVVGAAVGIYSARRVQMTAMPQMVALFNGAGGATAAGTASASARRSRGRSASRSARSPSPAASSPSASCRRSCPAGRCSFPAATSSTPSSR